MTLISSIEGLPAALAASVSAGEKNYIEAIKTRGLLPFGVSPYFASLARPEPEDPIRRQFFPDPREALPDPCALDDPLGEGRHRAVPRLIRQYRDRALLLAGGACGAYCRYCFRRVWLAGAPDFIGPRELEAALGWLERRPEIREILVSGGDPLGADNGVLEELFQRLRKARPGILLRICTRAPVVNPDRLGKETLALFRRFRPLRLSVHLNHPREFSGPCREGLGAAADSGIPVHVQTVLLRGVNDDAAILAELFRRCLDSGLSPYYLFQMDLAPGTAHFRVPLKRGLALYRELGTLISGLGLPAYAVDLPGGGGKIRLHEDSIAAERLGPQGPVYLLKDGAGKLWEYPAE
jgi:lysine 2,3-aminomutase